VALVPHLLGFQPTDSLVLLLLARKRVVLTVRLDNEAFFDGPPPADFLAGVTERGRTLGVTSYVALIWAPRQRAEHVRDAVVPVLGDRLGQLILVDGDRWWEADARPGGPGRPVPAEARPDVALLDRGRAVAPSRAALAASLAPPQGAAEDELLTRWGKILRRVVRWSDDTRRTTFDAVVDRVEAGRPVTADDYVKAAVLVHDGVIRERLWSRIGTETAHNQIDFWIAVVRHSPVDFRAIPLAMLGIIAWQACEGALMAVCHDEAIALDPDVSVVQLLTAIRDNLVPPSVWPACLAQVNLQLHADQMPNPVGQTHGQRTDHDIAQSPAQPSGVAELSTDGPGQNEGQLDRDDGGEDADTGRAQDHGQEGDQGADRKRHQRRKGSLPR
jgi:hypothetical protein